MSRHYPHWIRAYADHAQHSESPLIFHVWTAVSTIAGALRRRVWIDQVSYRYYPNFYIVLVGPPAITKTTAMNQGMKMLRKIKGVYFGPNSSTWQSFIKLTATASQELILEGQKITSNCPVTIAAGELGTFFKIDDHVMMDVLTDLWESPEGEWTHSTLSMGENTVESPCINFIGCTTPTWLKKHFPEDLIGGGLTSRIVFIYGDKKHQIIAYPGRHIEPIGYRQEEEWLQQDLERISKLKGPYHLTEEAFTWGEEWYEKHNTDRPKELASERYSGYLGRKQVHMHKLAMILAAAKRDEMIILPEDLQEALAMVEMAEPMMRKVFESIGLVDEARRTAEIEQLVRVYGTISADDLFGQLRNNMSSKEFVACLGSSVKARRLKVVMVNGERAITIAPTLAAQVPNTK